MTHGTVPFSSAFRSWASGCKWSDFATGARGGDIISWYAHAYNFDQGDAARQIAERLGLSAHKNNRAALNDDTTETAPKIYQYGEEGPPIEHNEVRRHYYPKTVVQN